MYIYICWKCFKIYVYVGPGVKLQFNGQYVLVFIILHTHEDTHIYIYYNVLNTHAAKTRGFN